MRIVGFHLFKFSIERKEQFEGKLDISQNINIKDVSKEKIDIAAEEIIRIKFNFNINYKDFANIEFEGNITILPEGKETKKILDAWKGKKIPEEIRVNLFNFIMDKCNIRALEFEDEMGIPLHIPLPRITSKEQETKETKKE